jgi:hypothetical protein
MPPHLQMMRDAFSRENVGEMTRAFRGLKGALSGDDINRALTKLMEDGGVFQIAQVFNRVVEIDIVIMIAITIWTNVVTPTDGDHTFEFVRMFE